MRVEARLRARARALRATAVSILQAAAAAGVAWFLAHDVLHHRNAFFAPVSAVIVLGLTPGNRTRRSVEMVMGVAVGIAVGELLISAIGSGAVQVGVVVLLAMGAAVLLGGGPLIASQAASSAVLVATVRTSSGSLVPTRFVDALVGGTVGIAILALAPRDPAAVAKRAAAPVFAGLTAVLEEIAGALERRDLAAAQTALVRARNGDAAVARLREALVGAEETTKIAPTHWHERGRIARYGEAAEQIELAVRNARVIARATVRAVELEHSVSPKLPASIRGLGGAAKALGQELDHPHEPDRVRTAILESAATASSALGEPHGFAVDALIAQIRSLATDLLRALGVEAAEAVEQIRAAAGERGRRAPRSPAPH